MRTTLLLLLLVALFGGCAKDPSQDGTNILTLPVLTTTTASSITNTTAATGGVISTDGNSTIRARGVCWSKAHYPSINDSHTIDGTATGTFTSKAVNLDPLTTYYLRAYATNAVGTGYGNEISFTTTNSSTALATLTTNNVTGISATGATSGGNITADGGAPITARGVCWATSSGPLVTGSHTSDGTGVGNFSSSITGLVLGTTYYVRAYATNSVGTTYGNELNFVATNTPVIPTVSTTAASAITATSASTGGNVTADGGAPVSARGICWGTNVNPDITGTHTSNGTGTGVFISPLTGLTANTTYHIRAYATNSAGTGYGSDLTFTTTASAVTVYVAGMEYTAAGPFNSAKLWQNGVPTSLTTGNNLSSANSVFVNGSDIYVAGWELISSGNEARVWKNGTPTILSSCNASANSVFVTGSDVYIAGLNSTCSPPYPNIVTYWKNGVANPLTNGLNTAQGLSIYVSGSDVYVAGFEDAGSGIRIAKIWKNGLATSLSSPTGKAVANSVFVSGSDVYVAGTDMSNSSLDVATLWKNGTVVPLSTGGDDTEANSVFVSGSDVYVAGSEFNGSYYVATLWKNGVPTHLSAGSSPAEATSVYVFGSDVYVVGYETNSLPAKVAKLWKNGVATPLTDGTKDAAAYSVFVK